MAKSRAWNVKGNEKTKNYHTTLGTTDFDIPMFGYKSAFFIVIITFVSLLIIPMICRMIKISSSMPTIILGGFTSGFSVAFSQFFIERKTRDIKKFIIIGCLFSVLAMLLLFGVNYLGILM